MLALSLPTSLPSKRKRHWFYFILKQTKNTKSCCLGGMWVLVGQWSGCPGDIVSSYFTGVVLCGWGLSNGLWAHASLLPSCWMKHHFNFFFKNQFPNCPIWPFERKRKSIHFATNCFVCLEYKKENKNKTTTKPKVATFETSCVYCTWQKTAPSFP